MKADLDSGIRDINDKPVKAGDVVKIHSIHFRTKDKTKEIRTHPCKGVVKHSHLSGFWLKYLGRVGGEALREKSTDQIEIGHKVMGDARKPNSLYRTHQMCNMTGPLYEVVG